MGDFALNSIAQSIGVSRYTCLSMDYISTNFSVDSSSRLPLTVRILRYTKVQTQLICFRFGFDWPLSAFTNYIYLPNHHIPHLGYRRHGMNSWHASIVNEYHCWYHYLKGCHRSSSACAERSSSGRQWNSQVRPWPDTSASLRAPLAGCPSTDPV